MATIDPANPPMEYPDIIGARPTNPLAANFRPFIPASARLPEFTPLPLIMGTFLGIIFGASSLYLVLKVGLTVSASIPVAVISITVFRLLSKLGFSDANVLQNNIVQTAGSAGESIAFGLGVTMPAIMILGFDLEITRVMLVAILGGLLGILMMIPLRRALIVDQHGLLKYPEGTACAEVLKAAATKESLAVADHTRTTTDAEVVNEEAAGGGKVIFAGFGIGFLYQAAMGAFKLWKSDPQKIFAAPFKGGSISATIEPALLGVGYIIGPRIASIMCAGGDGVDSDDAGSVVAWFPCGGVIADLGVVGGRVCAVSGAVASLLACCCGCRSVCGSIAEVSSMSPEAIATIELMKPVTTWMIFEIFCTNTMTVS